MKTKKIGLILLVIKYTSEVTENCNGEVYIMENEIHNGIRHNKKTMEVISGWVNNHKLL